MKKALSLILALVLCLSLCACSSKESEKYVGTYECSSRYSTGDFVDSVSYKEEMILNKDGTGLFKCVCTKDSKYVSSGAVLIEGNISWEESDGYIIIAKSGTKYLNMEPHYYVNNYYNFFHTNGNEPYNHTQTYELKGNKLFDVESNFADYDKVK